MGEQECFGVVGEGDIFLYKALDKDDLHRDNKCHRGIHILVETFGGGMIIQKKAAHTENGGKWSSAVSGHVRLGESYAGAAIREAKEELGLSIEGEDLTRIAKVNPSKETGNEFVVLYTYLLDPSKEEAVIGCDEVDELITCPLKDLIADMDKGVSEYSPAFVLLFNIFLTLYKEDIGAKI